MMILLALLLVILLLWMMGFLVATDFSVPLMKQVRQFRRILVIFPHADDEAITCGGSLHRFSTMGSEVTLLILTRGERGFPGATTQGSLADIRVSEARSVAKLIGITKLLQEDFGDGALHAKKQELTTYIAATIEREQPELLLTYDLAGFYGHTDHIACSEVITELKMSRFPEIPLWYVAFPKRLLRLVKLPDDIALDPHFKEKQAPPTHKIFIGKSVLPKIKSWYTYKSQRASFTKGIFRLLPIWFFLSMSLFEYFAEVSR